MGMLESMAKSFIRILDTIDIGGFCRWVQDKKNREVSPAVALYRTLERNEQGAEWVYLLMNTEFVYQLLEAFRDREVREWLFSDEHYTELLEYLKMFREKK